jgi:hypothetical protein
VWRELFTRAASAEDGASKQLAPHSALLFLKDHKCKGKQKGQKGQKGKNSGFFCPFCLFCFQMRVRAGDRGTFPYTQSQAELGLAIYRAYWRHIVIFVKFRHLHS